MGIQTTRISNCQIGNNMDNKSIIWSSKTSYFNLRAVKARISQCGGEVSPNIKV